MDMSRKMGPVPRDVGEPTWTLRTLHDALRRRSLLALAVFLAVAALSNGETEPHPLADLAGMGRQRPFAASVLSLAMFSLTGLPPTVGFIGKLLVFRAAIDGGLMTLALVGIFPISGRLTKNLRKLHAGVDDLAQGNYSARVDVSSKDEVGRLATAFNRMAGDIEAHQKLAVEREALKRELANLYR